MERRDPEPRTTYYDCRYENGDEHTYGSIIMVEKGEIAADVIEARGLGERLVYEKAVHEIYESASSIAEQEMTPKAFHAACWLGYQAIKSGAATVDEVLGDRGFVHEIAHRMHFPDDPRMRKQDEIVEMMKDVEKRTPGVWSRR